jgi:hypothetical protein
MPFLTELDSRARVKGSRDPLGLQGIWVHFGRKVVGNLTTVTGSVRGFTTTILGYHFVQGLQERDGGDGPSPLDAFLKFEQLAAYSRWHVSQDDEFRGIGRVKERLGNGSRVTLSAEQRHQILSNQKIYGLWGLFTVASRASGLLDAEEPALSPVARSFVEAEYVARLNGAGLREGKAITDLLRGKRLEVDLAGRHAPIAQAVASLLRPKLTQREEAFYRHHLARGGDGDKTEGRQPQLAELLRALPPDLDFGMVMVRRLIDAAQRGGANGRALAARLADIVVLESLIAPVANLFDFILARQGLTVAAVTAEIGRKWISGLRHLSLDALEGLEGEISRALGDAEAATRWVMVARALVGADYETALRLLAQQNAVVMKARNGSPWIQLTRDRLEVRFREETNDLAERSALPTLWRHSYFLDSLLSVVRTLEGRK